MMWYHGQDADWHKEAVGVMDIGTGRCGGLTLAEGVSISLVVVHFSFNRDSGLSRIRAMYEHAFARVSATSLPVEFVI